MAGLFDGFDDDFEMPTRPSRPRVALNLTGLELAAAFWSYESAERQKEALHASIAASSPSASDPNAAAWFAICKRLASAASALANADFRAVLLSREAQVLLGPLTPAESNKGQLDLGSFNNLLKLFQRRCTRFVLEGLGAGDEDDDDDEAGDISGERATFEAEARKADAFTDAATEDGEGGSVSNLQTPQTLRAASAVFIAAACVGLYLRANWTGPELSAGELEGIYPLPYASSLSPLLPEVPGGGISGSGGGGATIAGAAAELKAWAPVTAEASRVETRDASQTAALLTSGISSGGDSASLAEAEKRAEEQAKIEEDGTAAASAAGGEGGEALSEKEVERMMGRRKSPLDQASLKALTTVGSARDCYEHCSFPHFLVTARALLTALVMPPAPSGATADKGEGGGGRELSLELEKDPTTGEYRFPAPAAPATKTRGEVEDEADEVSGLTEEQKRLAAAATSGPAAAAALSSSSAAAASMMITPQSFKLSVSNTRLSKLHALTSSPFLLTAHLWAARAACLHQRSLSERDADKGLWGQCSTFYHRLGKATLHCSGHSQGQGQGQGQSLSPLLLAFNSSDVFLASLVEQELKETAAVDGQGRLAAAEHETTAAADEALAPSVRPKEAKAAAAVAETTKEQEEKKTAATTSNCSLSAHFHRAFPDAKERLFLLARLFVEWGHAQHHFHKTSAAKTSFFLAKRLTGLQTRLTGVLGRRTKFQKFDLAQLVLRAASDISGGGSTSAEGASLSASPAESGVGGSSAPVPSSSSSFVRDLMIKEALTAERLGAAQDGKFGAKALRASGFISGSGLREGGEKGDDTLSAAAAAGAGAGAGAAAAAGADASTATAAAEGGDSALIKASPQALGGVHTVRLDAVDQSNGLLEEIKLRPDDSTLAAMGAAGQEAAQRYKEDDAEKERIMYSQGWGKSMERPTATATTTSSSSSSEEGEGEGKGKEAASATPAASLVEDGPLTILDQTIILALCLDIKNHNPKDGLTQEEMRPFVARALDTPLHWLVHSSGLLVKSWLEFENHKTAERAALQMQALVDQHTNKLTPLQASQKAIDESAPAKERLNHCLETVFPPRWELKRQLADRYRKLGVLRSALVLYEEAECWTEVVELNIALDRFKRATKLLRQRLAIQPSPRLYCLLGHVTDDDQPFFTAWEVSKHSYAKARLDLGKRCLRKKDLDGAIGHLKAGLELAPFCNAEWFILGLAAMQKSLFELSLVAFSRVVQLEPSSSDAWANIGSIHLRRRDWPRAFAALEQAIKKDRGDWRMHSNFLVACMRCKNYSRALTTMHTLVELKKKVGGVGGQDDGGNEGFDVPSLGLLIQEAGKSVQEEQAIKEAIEERRRIRQQNGLSGVDEEAQEASSALASSQAAVLEELGAEGGIEGMGEDVFFLPPPEPDSNEHDPEDESGEPLVVTTTPVNAPSTAPDLPPIPSRKHTDAFGQPCSVFIPLMSKLFGHLTSVVTKDARIWQLYARLYELRGRREDASDCRLKMCRALQGEAGWEKTQEGVDAVCKASIELCKDYLTQPNPRNLLQARMYLQSTLGRIAAAGKFGTADSPPHQGVDEMKALQAEVAALSSSSASVAISSSTSTAGQGAGAGAGAGAGGAAGSGSGKA